MIFSYLELEYIESIYYWWTFDDFSLQKQWASDEEKIQRKHCDSHPDIQTPFEKCNCNNHKEKHQKQKHHWTNHSGWIDWYIAEQ